MSCQVASRFKSENNRAASSELLAVINAVSEAPASLGHVQGLPPTTIPPSPDPSSSPKTDTNMWSRPLCTTAPSQAMPEHAQKYVESLPKSISLDQPYLCRLEATAMHENPLVVGRCHNEVGGGV